MEEIIIKSEFHDETEENSLNFDMNASAENSIQDESVEGKYDFAADEYGMENRSEIMYDSNHGIEVEAQNNIQYNPAGEANANPGVTRNSSKTSNVRDGRDVRFEFTAGYRRNSVLIYLPDEKQLFTKKYTHNHLDRYTCYTKSCKASLLFDTYLNKIVKLYHTFHLHPDQSDVYKKMKVLNEMKDYCLTNDGSNLTTKQIFDRKCDVMKEAAHLVEYNKIKRNLNRLKKTAMQKPVSPFNYDELMKKMNDFAGATNDCALKWDTKLSNRAPPPVRVSSPTSSDGGTKSTAPSIETPATSVPIQLRGTKPPAFKRIKLSHEVPYTEGYLEEPTPKPIELRTSNVRKSPPRPNPRIYPDEGNHICSSCPCVAAQENEYDKMGKAWASELKLMTAEQQIFAKRAIAEILFEGQMGGLSRNSVLIRQENKTDRGDPFIIENTEYLYDQSEQN